MDAYLTDKCQRLLNGEEILFTDGELDELLPYNISVYIASKPNPNRVGTKDRWIAFIEPNSRERAINSNPFNLS